MWVRPTESDLTGTAMSKELDKRTCLPIYVSLRFNLQCKLQENLVKALASNISHRPEYTSKQNFKTKIKECYVVP